MLPNFHGKVMLQMDGEERFYVGERVEEMLKLIAVIVAVGAWWW